MNITQKANYTVLFCALHGTVLALHCEIKGVQVQIIQMVDFVLVP